MRQLSTAMLIVLVALCVAAMVGGCSESNANSTIKFMDGMLETMDKHGVTYRMNVEGPIETAVEMYQGVRAGTGGHVSVTVTNELTKVGAASDR